MEATERRLALALKACARMMAQRDALAVALRALVDAVEFRIDDPRSRLRDAARSALAALGSA